MKRAVLAVVTFVLLAGPAMADARYLWDGDMCNPCNEK